MAEPAKRAKPRSKDQWEALFQEYIQAGMAMTAFLKSKGINPNSGAAWKQTKNWRKRIEVLAVGAASTVMANHEKQAKKGKIEEVEASPILPDQPSDLPIGREAQDVRPMAQPSGWALIQQWRRKQSAEDWKTADAVRSAIKITLRDSIVRSPDGQLVNKLRPHELKAITQALADVQRIQRLSIGLSTENVGIDGPSTGPDDQHVEKPVSSQPEAELPLFIVEMSSRGRFLRPRPRRAN